jgi:hypothetical protein
LKKSSAALLFLIDIFVIVEYTSFTINTTEFIMTDYRDLDIEFHKIFDAAEKEVRSFPVRGDTIKIAHVIIDDEPMTCAEVSDEKKNEAFGVFCTTGHIPFDQVYDEFCFGYQNDPPTE